MEDVFSQGDGMRSFARMLLEIKTGERDIILIDEPELFLHPPQLRELARLIARETAPSTQFFIATHNETFLRSLLEYSMERVVLLRLKRHATATDITHLASEQVKQLWGDANISSSGVMGALFSHTSVLCRIVKHICEPIIGKVRVHETEIFKTPRARGCHRPMRGWEVRYSQGG